MCAICVKTSGAGRVFGIVMIVLRFHRGTGIDRLWRNWDMFCCLSAWAEVIKLAVAVVCDRVRQSIGPMSVALSTLGGGMSTVCGTLDLVHCDTGS